MQAKNSAFEVAKWIAVISMTCDHAGKILFPEIFAETHAIGRLAYPLLAGIVALRMSLDSASIGKYLRTLVPWGVASQPFYVVAGRQWTEGNILFSLALGVCAWAALREMGDGRWARGAVMIVAVALFSTAVEYGPAGVATIPALAAVARTSLRRGFLAIGPFGVLANLVAGSPPLLPVDLIALLATPIVLLTMPFGARLSRLPKHAFYAYYPLHLYALHLLDLHFRRV